MSVGPFGVEGNRRFFLVDRGMRMINGKRIGALQTILADYAAPARELWVGFPDGTVVTDTVAQGEPLEAGFFGGLMAAHAVQGPWSAAISEHVGEPLALLESDLDEGAIDRGRGGTVSLVSRATLGRLAAQAGGDGREPVDARRMRMLFEIEGVPAHEEDTWIGRPLRIGGAVISLRGHTGRCVVTTRDPQTGEQTLDTLKLLARYRLEVPSTEPLSCGVHGEVLAAGVVRIGDPVALT